MGNKYIVFDLDDTLYYEIDFLKSAFKTIANQFFEGNEVLVYEKMMDLYYAKEDVMAYVSSKVSVSKEKLLEIYRSHFPTIFLREGVLNVLETLKSNQINMGLLTDGRSITQRNKIKALGIEHFFDKIIISEEFGSEKPTEGNYVIFIEDPSMDYFYIGDNPKKDFVTPNKLGWTTIMIEDDLGLKIHSHSGELMETYQAQKNTSWDNFLCNI